MGYFGLLFLLQKIVVDNVTAGVEKEESTAPTQLSQKDLTDMRLKACFGAELRRTAAGMNEDINLCRNEDYAYFWAKQKVYLESIDRYPTPDKIKVSHPDVGEFVDPLWDATQRAHGDFISSAAALKSHWDSCPAMELPEFSQDLTAKPSGYFDGFDDKALHSLKASAIGRPYVPTTLHTWKTTERALRGNHYRCCKELLRSLRFYLEIVIDYAQKVEDKQLLQSVLMDNRHLRELDGLLHASVVERTIHFNQRPQGEKKDKRERKTGGPYSDHPIEAALFLSRHYTAFVIKKPRLGSSTPFLAPTISEPCHDAPEDSRYSVGRVIGTLKAELNHVDSSLPQLLTRTPQGEEIDVFLRQVLPLMREFSDEAVLEAVFRITNKNSVFTEDEIKAALQRNIAGPKKTHELLGFTLDTPIEEPEGLSDRDKRRFAFLGSRPLFATAYRERGVDKLGQPLTTFQEFPESHEPKMDQFLLRLFAISEASFKKDSHSLRKMAFHTSILDKIGDRWHNTKNMEPSNYKYRLTTLRGNVSRLLAFLMLDLNKYQYPLYNTLPEFIDLTLNEYEKLKAEWQELPDDKKNTIDWQPCDNDHIDRLKTWKEEVDRYDLSEVLDPEVLALTTSYNARALQAAEVDLSAA